MKKLIAVLFLASTLFAHTKAHTPLPPRPLVPQAPPKTGRWLMSEDGHAVFCYGPVLLVNVFKGDPKRVATECRGRSSIVPLRD